MWLNKIIIIIIIIIIIALIIIIIVVVVVVVVVVEQEIKEKITPISYTYSTRICIEIWQILVSKTAIFVTIRRNSRLRCTLYIRAYKKYKP